MGRGRGKGKKLTVSNHEDAGSGEEEKIPAQKRRGRPTKPLKDDIDEEVEVLEDEGENRNSTEGSKDMKGPIAAENGKKRKRLTQAKDQPDSVKEESGVASRSSTDDSSKSNGFRLNGSRRKNKPRRAAEAVVECR